MAEIISRKAVCKISTIKKAVFLYCLNLQKERLQHTFDEEEDIISDINQLFNL